MADDWSREEVEAIVSDYLQMLLGERRGEIMNKAEHNRKLRNILTTRSRGSVEFKHQNISAVLQELGYPWIEGYKPRVNVQDLLREVVEERLSEFPLLEEVIREQVTAEVSAPTILPDLLAILVPRPEVPKNQTLKPVRTSRNIHPRRPNYLEIEARNQSLGRAGEELVARFEQERLWRAGHKSLSDRVECQFAGKITHLFAAENHPPLR